ncbi:MAG: YraN family protein [Chloroflexi bacterium]|nr:YraN family protein [Chloroflexota bacterium]
MSHAADGAGPGLARLRRRSGERGEALAAAHLESIGWTIVARRVRVGRDEIDVLAVEPSGTPGNSGTLVVVEVRTRTTDRYGTPEESVDRAKVRRLYRAASRLRALPELPDGTPVPPLPLRVDLLAVDDAPAIGPGAGGPTFRHLRAIEPV